MADKVTSIPAIKPLKIDPVPIGELSEPMGGIDFDGISSPSLAAEEPAVEKIREHVEEDALDGALASGENPTAPRSDMSSPESLKDSSSGRQEKEPTGQRY